MTPFQKQVLLLEEERQNEQAQQQDGAQPQGTLNARNPQNSGYVEEHSYKNSREFETENQAEFIE